MCVLHMQEADSSAPEKWVRQHEQVTFRQLSFQRDSKKVSVREARGKALALARKVPVEILAKEWMNESQVCLLATYLIASFVKIVLWMLVGNFDVFVL